MKTSINSAQDAMGYSNFLKSAMHTYMLSSEAAAHTPKEQNGGGRRRYSSVDRALAYERSKRE